MRTGLKWARTSLVAAVAISRAVAAAEPCHETSTTGFPAVVLKEVAAGLAQPVHISAAPGMPGRLYIVEQDGRIRITEKGKVSKVPFLDLADRVESGGEQGLLSIAFHPRYQENHEFFVNYTARDAGGLHTRISRFRATNSDTADAASELVLIRIPQPYSNHNGGQIVFGPDGYLYVGMGDGGSANDPQRHAQNPDSLLGKMLRIDVDHPKSGSGYSVPKDNPFVIKAGYRPEIWAIGMRNPWRFSFDARTGSLWLADVGQDRIEEIDIVRKGGNYGWPIMEGDLCNSALAARCNSSGLIDPVFTYRHPEGFSITGGFVYRGQKISRLCGAYIYADYVTQKIWAIRVREDKVVEHALLVSRRGAISSFGQDLELELYVADHRSGRILQLIENKQ